MKSSFTKSQLVALYEAVGLNAAKTTLKPQLIDTLYDHLVNHPGDFAADPRLADFFREQENKNEPIKDEEDEESSKGTDFEDDAKPSYPLLSAVGDTSLTNSMELITDKMALVVDNTKAEMTTNLNRAVSDFHENFRKTRSVLSRVWLVNIVLLLAEYAVITFAFWPRDILGNLEFDRSSIINGASFVGRHALIHVVPALIVASLINFTHQTSLYRRKREHAVDPVIFGIIHLLIPSITAAISPVPLLSQLSMVTGLASAVVGIYAAVLRTQ